MKRRLVLTFHIKDDASFLDEYKAEPSKLFDQLKGALVPLMFTAPAVMKLLKIVDIAKTSIKYEEGEEKAS